MTFYQKVRNALKAHEPITHTRLADELQADGEAVRRTLLELKRRGKAFTDGGFRGHEEHRLWQTK